MCCAVTCAGQHGHLLWSPWRQNISRKHAKIFGNAKWNRKYVCYITFKDKPFFHVAQACQLTTSAHFVDIWRTVEMEYNYHLSINFCDTYFMSCFLQSCIVEDESGILKNPGKGKPGQSWRRALRASIPADVKGKGIFEYRLCKTKKCLSFSFSSGSRRAGLIIPSATLGISCQLTGLPAIYTSPVLQYN